MSSTMQGVYELDSVFSTFFPGKEVPVWFSNRSTASSISFTVPSLDDLTIQGLNICLVYEFCIGQDSCSLSLDKNCQPISCVEISTRNKAPNMIYSPSCFGFPEANQDMIWLSHWSIGNQLKGGDEVNVSVTLRTLFKLKEFGVDVVYKKERKQATQDKFYPSCSQSEYIFRTRMYNLNNQVFPKDDALASISCSRWENYICQTFAETTDEQKHPNSSMTGRAGGHKAVRITSRMKRRSRGHFVAS